ncbi:hypothetical protein PRIPAC_79276 [Pristionchus pacificus]|uniref:G protein-coupled receptor n=1 Tax=Pristionchus pacificus TaxID=54126 RepID=A0A2A6CQG4_PRIPA|nr:hypothetical protein PRIPAC_79276 [Pristionchus pacificus]|eukprot:PDM80360.1 G protein-coupled receptor [Pristionchus pacificus]
MLFPIIFHKAFVYSLAVISLLANSTLLLLLRHVTSKPLGNYKVLLFAFAVTDIFISLFHAWYIPIFVLGDFGYAFFGYETMYKDGPISSDADLIYAVVFFVPFCLLSLHFIYRYCSLVKPALTAARFHIFAVFCALYIIIYTLSVHWITSIGTIKGIAERQRGLVAEYEGRAGGRELNVRSLNYLEDDGQRINKIQVVKLFTASSIGGHTVIISLLCIYKISRTFDKIVLEISVRRLHVHLFRALIIQFVIPVIFSLIPMTLIFGLPATGIYLGQWGNVFGLLSSVFPALDPILIILTIGRFRSTLLRWVDIMMGTTARRNEKRAEAQSKSHFSMMINRSTRSL